MFGATGFTGGLTAHYLAEHAPRGTRWAIAGRSASKLEALARELEDKPCPPQARLSADVAHEASLRAMAEQARVVLTTVGPFDDYGEPLVRACVEAGTDYADITGEPRFVDRMIARYDDEARQEGLRIVSCCGFDSIPHDLGVLFTVDHLPKGTPITIEGFVRSRGTFSGGTWHSAVRAMGRLREHLRERRQRARRPATNDRKVHGVRPSVRYEPALECWVCPLPTIDPEVVLRSARMLDNYGPDFRYGHYARVKKTTTLAAGALAVSGVVLLAQIPATRALLLKVKDQGDGPSAEERARGWFTVTFLAKAGSTELRTEVRGGDPGYSETAKMLAESGLCLALDRDRLPPHTGVITPAAAMGHALIDRLERAGITFSILED
ncbi:MAG: saccharopine dehydrogenase NADP-binding domain-containing protein [Sandaracinaceae bacterium]|nr:saccharopine dehydrogenase NADP-binding domain-containing protein [Sandaracinaceae bacterium]